MDEEEGFIRHSADDRVVGLKINSNYCGDIASLQKDKAEIILTTHEDMEVDSGITHTGFIHSAASFAALCAINKKHSIIIGADVKYLAPIETNQKVIFKAKTLQNDMRKCEIKVEGFILDIKIFDGLFYIVVFDKKLFKLKLKEGKEI
ncbi:hot dog fold protein HP0420 [Helicobacter fennelliae]|uniref:Hot dog fold protein HP0420 n=2 Tax=Helicobacter fennelliae TaxID=215 RepID=T1DUT6_9HELI|nr:hot dog fold protein HP0420 [Helicobacter fennelliae]GAD17917.1 hot dog fold protein HP0420 [Helicobacter fennelliae MRY12-0050]SQB99357.1 Hot dog fold protein HP0420 [Helicobacter fennelliae]STP07656.1 Hot dog fold protein HP0420 [Helicobacter fennelliae]